MEDGAGAGRRGSKRPFWVGFGIAALTFAVFAPALQNGFVLSDDPQVFTGNPYVSGGFSLAAVKWAFSTGLLGNWHPLTWLSLMLDTELFGTRPAGYHLSNVLEHTVTAVLVFVFFFRTTGALWRSGFCAALFSLHPLRVESVAWATERKDTLSALFGVLALVLYARYARSPTVRRYLWVLGALVLSLLSKATLVTFPALALLLDVWPLRRMEPFDGKTLRARLLEKLPFAAVCLVFTALAVRFQESAQALRPLTLSWRMKNVAMAYAHQVAHFFFPRNLHFYYPLQSGPPPLGLSVLWGALLGASVVLAVLGLRRVPPLSVGWLWFVGLLFPLSGVVQMAMQAWVDRYMYLPSIGLGAALAFTFDFSRLHRSARVAVAAGAALWLGVLAAVTQHLIPSWKDSSALYSRALSFGDYNPYLHFCMGGVLEDEDRFADAEREYRTAADQDPLYARARFGVGAMLVKQGQARRGIEELRRAELVGPTDPYTPLALASVFEGMGQLRQAEAAARRGLALAPEWAATHATLGRILGQRNRLPAALAELNRAVALEPANAANRATLGITLARAGRFDEAVQMLEAALQLAPGEASWAQALALAREDAQKSHAP